jgi:hypothetical protein
MYAQCTASPQVLFPHNSDNYIGMNQIVYRTIFVWICKNEMSYGANKNLINVTIVRTI